MLVDRVVSRARFNGADIEGDIGIGIGAKGLQRLQGRVDVRQRTLERDAGGRAIGQAAIAGGGRDAAGVGDPDIAVCLLYTSRCV